jgi:hypothetical protein
MTTWSRRHLAVVVKFHRPETIFFHKKISRIQKKERKQETIQSMKLVLTALSLASLVGSAVGFVPATSSVGAVSKSTSLALADVVVTEEPIVSTTEEPIVLMEEPMIVLKSYPEVNGWTADASKFCAGLPGSSLPFKDFDPLGLMDGMSVEEIKRYRESEVTHGRVAMLATVGYLVGESSFHPLFGGSVLGPANSHLAQVQDVAPAFFTALTLVIGASELYRAKNGWNPPPVSTICEVLNA